MFARAASFIALALPVLVAANAIPRGDSPSNQCTTGTLQCCNTTKSTSDQSVSDLLGLLGIAVESVTALVGLTCSGITVVGTSGSSCTAQPICCTDNYFDGLISIGCSPITINL